jgi:hypothetical protein
MEASLVVGTLEIPPSQCQDSFVVPPQKESNYDVESPRTYNLAPNRIQADVQRGHYDKRSRTVRISTLS